MLLNDWLGDEKLQQDIWKGKYRQRNETLDEFFKRVSCGNSKLEKLIKEKKVIPAGRTLTNLGIDNGASISNCYSAGYCPDDTSGILDLNKAIALTFKAQGGQGISLTKVRPRGAKVRNDYASDGIIPFMEMFNCTTDTMKQGSGRRGALLMSLDICHKDAKDFITIKSQNGKINRANLSLEIDDEFMEAVEAYYKTGEVKTIRKLERYGNVDYVWMVTPIELFKLLAKTSYDWAEPGVLFTNRFRNYNFMENHSEYKIITCNPCGEQPLPAHGACALISINVAEFILEPYTSNSCFDWHRFKEAVEVAVEAENQIIEEGMNRHILPEQREMARQYRNIGVGICGFGTALIKLGCEYGSAYSKTFAGQLMSTMVKTALLKSNELAKEFGAFEKFERKSFMNSKFLKNLGLSQEELDSIEKYGVRNCSLLSIAPTGSIGTMFNVSTGIEPNFALKYNRKTENLGESYEVFCKEVQDFWAINKVPEKNRTLDKLPKYFVTAEDINWKDRIDIQAAMQDYVDTGISSTINLPESTTVEEIEQLYLYAWKKGLKGVTIFRNGGKREGILTTEKKDKDSIIEKEKKSLKRGLVLPPSDNVIGLKRLLTTGCGSLHCAAFFDEDNKDLKEIFLMKGSQGGCNSFMIGLSRLISLAARAGVSCEDIIDQLMSAPACSSFTNRTRTKKDTSKGTSCPQAVGYALREMLEKQKKTFVQEEKVVEPKEEKVVEKNPYKIYCEICGEEMIPEGGCHTCPSCGNNKCGD